MVKTLTTAHKQIKAITWCRGSTTGSDDRQALKTRGELVLEDLQPATRLNSRMALQNAVRRCVLGAAGLRVSNGEIQIATDDSARPSWL